MKTSMHDKKMSNLIMLEPGVTFYSLILAALFAADTDNQAALVAAFPDVAREALIRYYAPNACVSVDEFLVDNWPEPHQREEVPLKVLAALFQKATDKANLAIDVILAGQQLKQYNDTRADKHYADMEAERNQEPGLLAPADMDLVNILVIVRWALNDQDVIENLAGLLGLVPEDVITLQNRLHAYLDQAPDGTPDAEKYGEDYLAEDQEPNRMERAKAMDKLTNAAMKDARERRAEREDAELGIMPDPADDRDTGNYPIDDELGW